LNVSTTEADLMYILKYHNFYEFVWTTQSSLHTPSIYNCKTYYKMIRKDHKKIDLLNILFDSLCMQFGSSLDSDLISIKSITKKIYDRSIPYLEYEMTVESLIIRAIVLASKFSDFNNVIRSFVIHVIMNDPVWVRNNLTPERELEFIMFIGGFDILNTFTK
jgi:hypothetical protein